MKTIVLLMALGLVGCLSTEEIETTEEAALLSLKEDGLISNEEGLIQRLR